jgi:hypothetical protein
LPVSKMFIYRVTGTLAKPHSEPLILTPFHSTARPYKQLVPLPEPTPTNGPPATP